MQKTNSYKIQEGDSPTEAIIKISEGNVGAGKALIEIIKENQKRPLPQELQNEINLLPEEVRNEASQELKAIKPLLTLDNAGVHGHLIWMLYKDVCKENPKDICDLLSHIENETIPHETLHNAIQNRGAGLPKISQTTPASKKDQFPTEAILKECQKIPTDQTASPQARKTLAQLTDEWLAPSVYGAGSTIASTTILSHIAPELHPATIFTSAAALGAITTALISIPWRAALKKITDVEVQKKKTQPTNQNANSPKPKTPDLEHQSVKHHPTPQNTENPPQNIVLNIKKSVQKFIFGRDKTGLAYIVSSPRAYHIDILEDFTLESKIPLKKVSGGYIEKSGNSYSIYGRSESFGQAPLKEVQELLQNTGLEVNIGRNRNATVEMC